MTENTEQTSEKNTEEKPLSKKELLLKYATELDTVQKQMEPLREHLKDLKQNYVDNELLSREEMSMVLRAYRMRKGEIDMEQLNEFYDLLKSMKS